MHASWLASQAQAQFGRQAVPATATVETRFRYNPDVKSLPAMVPAVIPMLLMMIPAMLTALSVVREKELGSIVNLYVTPVTRSEFLLGKQLPYIGLAMLNFLLMTLLAVTMFDVPIKGSFVTLLAAALAYVVCATGMGLLASTFTKSQIAAMFLAMIGTLIPAVQFSGMIDPVSSLEGIGAFIGHIYPTTHFLDVSRGVFNKALSFAGHARVDLVAAARDPGDPGARDRAAQEAGQVMRFLSNVFRLGVKELWSLWRDPIMLVFVVYTFTLSVYTSATAMPESLHNAPIAIVDEDASPLSARIASAFYPPHFTRPAMISLPAVDPGMDAGVYTFALTIPTGFQRDVLAGKPTEMQLNVDATRMSQAFTGSGYIQQIVSGEVNEFVQRYRGTSTPPVDLALRARFNPALKMSWFGSVMSIINNITMVAILLTGAALIREREHGTIEHLLVMPVTPAEIMTAKVWAMGLVVLLATAVSLVFVVQGALEVTDQRLGAAVPGLRRAVAVRHHGDRHLHGDRDAVDAAVRAAADPGAAAAADAVGRLDAGREHARVRAAHHAGRADHALRLCRAGHPVPRRRARRGVAAVPGHRRHRRAVLLVRAGALSQDDQPDGLTCRGSDMHRPGHQVHQGSRLPPGHFKEHSMQTMPAPSCRSTSR